MTDRRALIGVVLLTATAVLGGDENVEKTILQLEKQWSAASVREDVAARDRILFDDYVGIEAARCPA